MQGGQDGADVVVQPGLLAPKRQRPREKNERLFVAGGAVQGEPEQVEHIGVVRRGGEQPAKNRLRLGKPARAKVLYSQTKILTVGQHTAPCQSVQRGTIPGALPADQPALLPPFQLPDFQPSVF